MDNSRGLEHEQAFEVLPWYVTGRLEAQESHGVGAHLTHCPDCQREAHGLTQMMSLHQQATPERPVDEARLHALLGRIERYEAGQPDHAGGGQDGPHSAWEKFKQQMQSWLSPMRPMVLAGACTAAILAAIGVSTLRAPVSTDAAYEVQGPSVDALQIRLRFENPPDPRDVEQLVRARYTGSYRIEPVTDTEYVVSLENKPGVEAISKLVSAWRDAPDVMDVQIDRGMGSVEN